MLGKLIKHEWKSTARLLLPLNLLIIGFSIIGRILLGFNVFKKFEEIGIILLISYILFLVVCAVVTYIFIIYRFYKNHFTDEGYLMFTLPAKPYELILSKLILAFGWLMINMVVITASIILLVSYRGMGRDFLTFWREFCFQMEAARIYGSFSFLICFILMTIIGAIYSILQVYFCIAVGQLFLKYKLIAAVGVYFGINFILQMVSTIVLIIFGFFTMMDINNNPHDFLTFYQTVMYIGIALSGLIGGFYFVMTNYIMKKKLNLE